MSPLALLLSAALALLPLSTSRGVATKGSGVEAASQPAATRGAADPRIWCVYPSNARPLDRVIVFGTGFDLGALAYFGSTPSIPLFAYATPDSDAGSFSFLVVPVPPALFGNTALTIDYLGQTSNPEPFQVRLTGGGYQQGPDPELWCSQPEAGAPFDPVALFGYDFTEGSVPYFGGVPSVNLGAFTSPLYVPSFGTFSALVTLVPPSFPGTVQVKVRRSGDSTEGIPFRIRR